MLLWHIYSASARELDITADALKQAYDRNINGVNPLDAVQTMLLLEMKGEALYLSRK